MISQGTNCTVYLAVHTILEEYRIIKKVSRSCAQHNQFWEEASYMKQLRHPGIPIIYDIEQDSEHSFLIEEYLDGETLYDLVNSQVSLAPLTAVAYGIQICELLCYLHSSVGNNPILHLDLHPGNLLICQETVKLIDFNHAANLTLANGRKKRYGTAGYAAPEQYSFEHIDQRTDIYSIGAVLFFMLEKRPPDSVKDINQTSVCHSLNKVIKTCLNPNKEKRYQSVEQLLKVLKSIQQDSPLLPRTLSFVGSKSGVGVTHLSIGFSSFLWRIGYPNLYEECNDSCAVDSMAEYFEISRNSHGFYQIFLSVCKPYYGEAVKLKPEQYPIIIRDFGIRWTDAQNAQSDVVVLLAGGQIWEQRAVRQAIAFWCRAKCLIVVYRIGTAGLKIRIPSELKEHHWLAMPYDQDPFTGGKKISSFYEMLWENICRKEEGTVSQGFMEKIKAFIKRIKRLQE